MKRRDLAVVKHEAAHIVVGVGVRLRLRRAVIARGFEDGDLVDGYVWFTTHGSDYAHAIMYAAGVAWDRMHREHSPADAALCREIVKTDANVRTCVHVASIMLAGLSDAHAEVVRALSERDLSDRDIRAIARGERPTDE